MSLSTDRSAAAQDIMPGSSTAASPSQRRDMAVVWWSTYLSLVFLAFFVYGMAVLVRISQDPQPVAMIAAVLGSLTMVPWAMTIRRARRGVDRTTFRTRTMACAVIFSFATALISVWAPPALGVGALPLAFVLVTAALSLGKGRWWVILISMFLPAIHLYVATLLSGQPAEAQDLVWVTWVSFFAVIGAPTSLWVWAVMVELDVTRQRAAELAISNERLRFAADLHDVQGHHLQVISLKTDLASRLLARGRPDTAAHHVLEAHDAAQNALQETRALVQGYRRTTLTQELNNASSVLQSAGVSTTVDVPELITTWSQQPETTDLGAVMGLTVREATTNILRHSEVGNAHFVFSFRDTASAGLQPMVELCIRNDGALPVTSGSANAIPSGSGLAGLKRRLAEVEGQLAIETTPDHEFLLRVSVPRTTDVSAAHEKDNTK
ncbi:hypothetical protein IEE91_10850 [Kocuria sp. cx-455]|uniref:histidine kinase n=1 Tax=Kocuria sp. cx-455 TaxID=2771377 RepID=UPI001687AF4B|nr:histidine kinase [Kocuria sp. cx-455]MBD2765675.1 hypothetical protein [Kocuria sp. cx-455]